MSAFNWLNDLFMLVVIHALRMQFARTQTIELPFYFICFPSDCIWIQQIFHFNANQTSTSGLYEMQSVFAMVVEEYMIYLATQVFDLRMLSTDCVMWKYGPGGEQLNAKIQTIHWNAIYKLALKCVELAQVHDISTQFTVFQFDFCIEFFTSQPKATSMADFLLATGRKNRQQFLSMWEKAHCRIVKWTSEPVILFGAHSICVRLSLVDGKSQFTMGAQIPSAKEISIQNEVGQIAKSDFFAFPWIQAMAKWIEIINEFRQTCALKCRWNGEMLIDTDQNKTSSALNSIHCSVIHLTGVFGDDESNR